MWNSHDWSVYVNQVVLQFIAPLLISSNQEVRDTLNLCTCNVIKNKQTNVSVDQFEMKVQHTIRNSCLDVNAWFLLGLHVSSITK